MLSSIIQHACKYPHAYKTDERHTYQSKYTFKFYPVGLVTLFNYSAVFTDWTTELKEDITLRW